MKYKVTFRYRGKFSVDVEADSEEEAARIGQTEAEEEVTDFLRLDCVDIEFVS
jgi:hypothetical protein